MKVTFTQSIKLSIVGWILYLLVSTYIIIPDQGTTTTTTATTSTSISNAGSSTLIEISHSTTTPNNTLQTTTPTNPVVTIAYAVSFIKCSDQQTNTAGLVDASLILRHSIHRTSIRNPTSGSRYDYKMYAIIHKQAESCSSKLKDVGFETIVVDPPIRRGEIKGDYLRKTIHKEWCCGEDEFVKLYAYTLPHEIIVHVDIDYAFYKPLDHLFDAILYDKDSDEGKKAREALDLERPTTDTLPDRIGAFITRDWAQVAPGKFPPAYQAGFLVARRDPSVMPQVLDIVREGNYTDGWGVGSGWSGSGHGGYVGARAMQGLMAYYYDFVRRNNAVELNQCRHNHMGMDVLYRHNPNYSPRIVKKEYLGGCRNTLKYCEDCMVTEFDKIYSVHYTMCRKPWQCISIGNKKKPKERLPTDNKYALPLEVVNEDHCHELVRHWHDLRLDFEKQLHSLTGDDTVLDGTKNEYRSDIFRGHCTGEGNEGYAQITGTDETFKRVAEIYNKQ